VIVEYIGTQGSNMCLTTRILAHAAQIVLDVPVKKTMIPLNVTHTAIVTRQIHARLLDPRKLTWEGAALPEASSKLRHTISTLISFFAQAYRLTFGFTDGPPIHDALTIAYVSNPDLFICDRYRVDVELTGQYSSGETVVDLMHYRSCDESWGPLGKNCFVAKSIDVITFVRSQTHRRLTPLV
jgi:uridine nucleosidase